MGPRTCRQWARVRRVEGIEGVKANLVAGMQWFRTTLTVRFNRRHRVGLRTFEIAIDDLPRLPKGDERKLTLAALIRQRTSVPNAWIAQRLNLGHVSRVSRCRIDAPTRIGLATLVTQNLDSCAQFTD
jgi:hypothetical protein